jgi:methionyl-tRNA formyltransferase
MRAVFFGTPELAVPALRALCETATVVGVVCQPDRPAGRGLHLHEPPVKAVARDLGLEVHQPVKVKTGNLDEWVRERAPDVALVLAYGRILPPAVLSAPRRGCINLHASLLPKYRGAAPIHWAVVRGESETGVSLMQMEAGLDTGPVYAARKIPVGPEDTTGELSARIAELAAAMVRDELPRAVAGELVATAQDDAAATWAPPIREEHQRIDWTHPAQSVVDLVRGLAPAPSAFTTLRGQRLKVLGARLAPDLVPGGPGQVSILQRRRVLVPAADGAVELLVAQLPGRKALGAAELVNGRALAAGDRLGDG